MKKRRILGGLAALLVVFSTLAYVQAAPDNAATTPAKPNPPAASSPAYKLNANELKALELLNADRQAANLPPLTINLTLSKLAADFAIDMNNRKFFNHIDPDGKDPFDRMAAVGIDFPNAGENIAVSPDVATAHKMLFNSPKHKENILNPKFTEVGIGVRPDSRGGVYLVQEFIGP